MKERDVGEILANQKRKHRGAQDKKFLFLFPVLSGVPVINVVIFTVSAVPLSSSWSSPLPTILQYEKLFENFEDSSNFYTT